MTVDGPNEVYDIEQDKNDCKLTKSPLYCIPKSTKLLDNVNHIEVRPSEDLLEEGELQPDLVCCNIGQMFSGVLDLIFGISFDKSVFNIRK